MSQNNTCFDELIKEDLKVFREFDVSSFVRNAKFDLTNKVLMPINSLTLNKYIEILQSSINDLNNLQFDSKSIGARLQDIRNSIALDKLSGMIPDMKTQQISDIRPAYIKELTEKIGQIIDKIVKGEQSKKEIDTFTVEDIASKMKKMVVKVSDKSLYNFTAKNFYHIKRESLPVSKDTINTYALPFCDLYATYRKNVTVEATTLLTAIIDTKNTFDIYTNVLNKMLTDEQDTEKIQLLYYFVYNAMHAVLTTISFTTTMMVKKIQWFIENAHVCEDIVNKYDEFIETEYTTESVFERNMVSQDVHTTAVKLMDGKIDTFEVLSEDVMNYHKSMVSNQLNSDIIGDDMHSSFDYTVDDHDYDHTAYENACKAFIAITNSLEIVAANSDDVLLIFDDIIEKSGLGHSLLDQFKPEIEMTKDISQYTSVVDIAVPGSKNDIYFIMLKELKDFPANMEQFAKIVQDTKTILMSIKTRFEGNDIGSTFQNSAAAVELRTYMETMSTEFDTLVELFTENFLDRLRGIAENLEKLSVIQNDNRINNGEEIEATESFSESIMDTYIAEFEAATDEIFKSLVLEYNKEKEFAERGVHLILEAEQPAQENNNTQEGGDGKPKVVDNAEAKNSIGNNTSNVTGQHDPDKTSAKFGNILEVIKKFIDGIVESISSWIGKDIDKKWFEEVITVNGEQITRRAYLEARCNKGNGFNSVQVQCPEFERLMPHKNLTSNYEKLLSNAGRISLDSIKNEADARIKVYGTLGIKVTDATNKDQVGNELINWCKHGNVTAPENKTYSNSDVKNCVQEALAFCDYYFNQFGKDFKAVGSKVDSALSPLQSAVMKESAMDISIDNLVEMYMKEAEETVQNQNNQEQANTNNAEATNTDKLKWISIAVQIYARAVSISAKQRKNSYMSILKGLCNQPAAETAKEENKEEKPEEKK